MKKRERMTDMKSLEQTAGVMVPPAEEDRTFSFSGGKKAFLLVLPLLSIVLTAGLDRWLPRAFEQRETEAPYFLYFLAIGAVLYGALLLAGTRSERLREKALYEAPFYAAVAQILDVINLLTAKYAVLPVLYFPAPDRIIEAMVTDAALLGACVVYSYSLLGTGWILGVLVGIGNGAWMGFSKSADYWLWPFIKALGPIPPVAWIPVVLVLFPTMYSGSVFLIFLAVWFPVASLTYSGIRNVSNSYFEVADTLGASRLYQIFHVGIPAAMPNVFMGLFMGTCMSFIVLVTAEMVGAKYGLGWYVNWQKETMSYANVYAGLILIAASFCLFMAVLFKIRERVLAWQKGVIKW